MTTLNRRECLTLLGTAASGLLASPAAHADRTASMFSMPKDSVYLNAARMHPLSNASVQAVQRYLETRSSGPFPDNPLFNELEERVKKSFAQLINAAPGDVSFVPSAQVAENLVVNGLGLKQGTDKIVTDALHYRGCLYLYGAMAQRGFEVQVLRPRDNRIQLEDMAKAIDSRTKLVAVSLVSYMNGFEHDLKALCDLAHAKGALVYADIVQAVGAVPLDVRASGVDFCGATAHKWLMGDHGLGFLYVRPGLLGTRLVRSQYGTDQVTGYVDHVFPSDPPVDAPATWSVKNDAGGYFEVGAKADFVAITLESSLAFLNSEGVANIQKNRRPLMEHLMTEIPKLGYPCVTPTSDTSIVSFDVPDKDKVMARLKAKNISVSMIEHTMRVSPSVYNTHADAEKLLVALRG